LIIGSNTYSLTLILIAVLLGISLGAYSLNLYLIRLHKKNVAYNDALKNLLFLFAITIVISSTLFNKLPWLLLMMNNLFDSSSIFQDLWLIQNLIKFSLVSLIVIPVTFIEGLCFAFIIYLVSSKSTLVEEDYQDPVGTRVARASSLNTLGAIFGSFLTGFVFLPAFSKLGNASYFCLLLLIAIAFLVALIPYLLDNKEKWKIFAIISLACVSIASLPKLNPQELSSGVGIYNSSKYKSVSKKEYKSAIQQNILFHKEGMNATITVEENKIVNAIFLKNNGKIEAGVPLDIKQPSKTDMITQILLGKLPILLKPESETALVIGMGSGVTLKALADAYESTKLQEIDVCELEELVYTAADKFFIKDYPPAVKINRHTGDARIFLQSQQSKSYDLIISQPSDPWISGSLFTKEFWSNAATRLEKEGLFIQWLQLYSIDPEYLNIALRTFQQVFPETIVFKAGTSAELILVGSKSKININSFKLSSLINHPANQTDLAYIGINNSANFLANLILTPKDTRRLTERNIKRYKTKSEKNKTEKYISDISDNKALKPKLSQEKFKDLKYKEAVDKFKGQTSTDDNMLLEFHTSKNIDNFYKTIEENHKLLFDYVNAESIIEFLVEQSKPGFLLDLALAHNQLVRDSEIYKILGTESEPYLINTYKDSINGKLAQGLASSLHELNKTPKSFLTLYKVLSRQNELERAEALIFDSKNYFSDLVAFKRKNSFSKPKLVVFEGLIKQPMNAEELAALAKLYNLYSNNEEDNKLSQELISKAFDYYKEKNIKNVELEAHLFFVLAVIHYERIKNTKDELLRRKLFPVAFSALELATNLDSINPDYYIELAKLNILKSKYYPAERSKLLESSRKLLEKSIEIFPNNPITHFFLAEIYLARLPSSQIELMDILNSPISKRNELENIDNAIKYLRNTISLEPLSISANYEMSNLQYRIGNIDLAHRHIKRLRKLCLAEMMCLNELGETKLNHAKELYSKISNLLPI
jgi:hypothetical protein